MPRQRILWAMIGLTLAGAIGATTLAGFRLHHAVLLERQTLRTQELSQAASATSRPSRRPTSRSSSAARTGSSGDLLLVAETERGPLALDLRPVDLELLAEDATESARPAAGSR